jgi:c-di-GMP-binding flagellar brake protein YcgR
MDERRQLPRWEIKKEAKVWIPLTQGFSECMIEDMHLKGMCVSFNKRLPHQENIRMSFTIGADNYDFIKIEAKIPWMKENQGRYAYGLSFSRIGDEDKDRIYQYINANCYDQIKDKWWAA